MNKGDQDGQDYRKSMHENASFLGKRSLEGFYWAAEKYGRTDVRKDDYQKWGVELPVEVTITGEPEPSRPL